MKKILIASVLSLVSVSSFASTALVVPQNVEVKQGQTALISAMYKYEITNNTSSFQNYVGFEELEVNGVKNKFPINFSLAPHGFKARTDFRTLNYETQNSGKYTIHASIKIIGVNGAAHNANATLTVN